MSKNFLEILRDRRAEQRERDATELPIREVRREPTLAERNALKAVDKALNDVQNAKDGLPPEHPLPRVVRYQEPERPKRTQADIIRSIGKDTANAYFTQAEHVANELVRLAVELERRSARLRARADEINKRILEHATGYASEVAAEYDKIAQAEEVLDTLNTRFPSPPKTVEALPDTPSHSGTSESEASGA